MNGVVVSLSSDIGAAAARRWLDRGWRVAGTFRHENAQVRSLRHGGADTLDCDLASAAAIGSAAGELFSRLRKWDVMLFCPGTMVPIGSFPDLEFDSWAESIDVNFTAQLRFLHTVLPWRSRDSDLGPCAIFLAGGGTNGAPTNYSAYTVSKIALIKMCELLHVEVPDMRISIVGPGWVRTKIHRETLEAGRRAGASYQRTIDRLVEGDFTSMEHVLDCFDWIIGSPRAVVGGRNFSVAFDPWGEPELGAALAGDADLFKLRRFGNARWARTNDR